jgi:hypothetical protein
MDHRTPEAFHRCVVRGDELSRNHCLYFILRPDPDQRHYGRAALTVSGVFLAIHPKTADGLIGQDIIPVVRGGAAEHLEPTLEVVRIES